MVLTVALKRALGTLGLYIVHVIKQLFINIKDSHSA